jgi:demethylmenaquinone methyltransferase/2-methoxy-6-polyprenyl-1,4-benzoquinol methylase
VISAADDRMRRYYAARAEEYDRVYAKPERQADIRTLRDWLPTRFQGVRVLDVAAGTGFWTETFAPVAREVVLVDVSAGTLAVAERRLSPEKARFVVGDAYKLPVRSRSVDAAFVGFWLSHVPKERRVEFLAELHRCVQPGGTVAMIDNRYVEGSSHPISGTDEAGNTYQNRRLDDGSVHRVLKNFPSEEELVGAVRGHGADATYWGLDYYWVLRLEAANAP